MLKPTLYLTRLLQSIVKVLPAEIVPLLWAFAYFFCLLCGYYIIRPLRNEMAIAAGTANLQWTFTGVFVIMLIAVPLFGWVASRCTRVRLIKTVYVFFALNMVAFFALFKVYGFAPQLAQTFFIWVSVYNLFVVSVFWCFMVDIFSSEQGTRLFGFIAAGGSIGAITGPALTAGFATSLGALNLIPLSALLLLMALICVHRIAAWKHYNILSNNPSELGCKTTPQTLDEERAISGEAFAGITLVLHSPYMLGICALVLILTTVATFLYAMQANLMENAFTGGNERTRVFALLDLTVNGLTVIAQMFLAGRLIRRIGLPAALAILPSIMFAGLVGIALAPALPVLFAAQILRRVARYGIALPAGEVLFTVISHEARYKAKNFIDTVIHRGGDALSAWVYTSLKGFGLAMAHIAWFTVPLILGGIALAMALGRRQMALKAATVS